MAKPARPKSEKPVEAAKPSSASKSAAPKVAAAKSSPAKADKAKAAKPASTAAGTGAKSTVKSAAKAAGPKPTPQKTAPAKSSAAKASASKSVKTPQTEKPAGKIAAAKRPASAPKAVDPIPQGYPGAIPYLIVGGAAKAIDFYVKAFGAKERMRLPMPAGKVAHAELEIGSGVFMLADEFPDMGFKAPRAGGESPITLMVYVEDVDALAAKAAKSGAKITQKPENQFYGDRTVRLSDPFGHVWTFATHIEDLTPDEIANRMAQAK